MLRRRPRVLLGWIRSVVYLSERKMLKKSLFSDWAFFWADYSTYMKCYELKNIENDMIP